MPNGEKYYPLVEVSMPNLGIDDIQITEHFRLREFAVSAEYPKIAAAMEFNEFEATKIFYLCHYLLEPLRVFAAEPLTILSSKRTDRLNNLVAGSLKSQHLYCEAADFACNKLKLKSIFDIAVQTLNNRFHQLIIYYDDEMAPRFIHASIPSLRDDKKRRGAFYHQKGQLFRYKSS